MRAQGELWKTDVSMYFIYSTSERRVELTLELRPMNLFGQEMRIFQPKFEIVLCEFGASDLF